ncbi:Monocarboxylate transporter [Trichoderma guizhouense]|uniref:Monocarboxylate transporter n=1 Tax=Trichoderma guizhouense TaxID=1491466 RepID=A0A1T3CA10_9HYPO|nr:Monocarboxylate transporter [Trichoderma guizhouense]
MTDTDQISNPDSKSGAPSSVQDQETAETKRPKPQEGDAPDGGTAAWLVVLGIGVFQEYYQTDLLSHYSPSTIAWIPSLLIAIVMGLVSSNIPTVGDTQEVNSVQGPFIGTLYDHFGPRWLLLIGSIMHIFGVMMASLGTEYYQILLAQGVCSAIGISGIFQPAVTATLGWFNQRRGAAIGILFTGSSIGGIIFPIMISHLIRELGFGWAMRISAFLMLFLLILANLTVRGYVPPHPHKVTRAELLKPLTEVDFLLLIAGFFCFSYGFFAIITYLPVQALNAGMNADLVQYLLPILNAGSLFGRLSAGVIGDKIGRFNVFIIVCFLSGIWVLALWLPDSSDPALIAFAVLFGFFSGAYVSLITPMVAQIAPLRELGFRSGIVQFSIAIGGLTTNPINGAILDGAGGWVGLKVFSGVFCIAGTAFVLAARIRRIGWKVAIRF